MNLDSSFGHAEGAALMFYDLFPKLEERFDAFLLAEVRRIEEKDGSTTVPMMLSRR